MQRSKSYSFQPPQQQHAQQTHHVRNSSTQNTSSAFSASANPNEDWTKISDLAERRRIQNRIAQRNYRKKLKRKLEDLERKTVSTSNSPEPSHTELFPSAVNSQGDSSWDSKVMPRQSFSRASSTYSHDQQLSPSLFPLEDPFTSHILDETQFFLNSTPIYSYANSLTSSDYYGQDIMLPDEQQTSDTYATSYFQPQYLHPLPSILPSTGPSDVVKQDPCFTEEDLLNPFDISYAALTGMETHRTLLPQEYSSRCPSISDSWMSDGSRENSPPYFVHQPLTPISPPTSPNVHLFEQIWRS